MEQSSAFRLLVFLLSLGLKICLPGHIVAEEKPVDEDPVLREIQTLIEQADSLLKASQLDSAIVLGKIGLEKATIEFGEEDTLVARALNVMGECYFGQSNYAEAESLYNKSLIILEQVLGPDHPDIEPYLNNLVLLYKQQGKFTEAQPIFERLLSIAENIHGLNHPDVVKHLNNLAIIYAIMGEYNEAEILFSRALSIREQALGPDHYDVATSLNNLAILYKTQGKYDSAEKMHKRALGVWETLLGPDNLDVATSLHNLAVLCDRQGKFVDAESYLNRALAIREKVLEPNHPDIARSLNELSVVYLKQGKYNEAVAPQRQALAFLEEKLGPNHPDIASSLTNLSILYYNQGNYTEAELLQTRALEILKESLGPDHSDVAVSLTGLANIHRNTGNYIEAGALYEEALRIREKALGSDHPDVASTLNSFAVLYSEQGNQNKAEEMHKRSLAIREKELGPNHPDVARSLSNLAITYDNQGKYTEAEPLHKKALEILESSLGPNHPDVSKCLGNLAKNYSLSDKLGIGFTMFEKWQQSRNDFIISAFSAASEAQKLRYLEKHPLIEDSFLSLTLMNPTRQATTSTLEMILKGKAVVIDAVSAEKQVAFCSDDNDIREKVERRARVSEEIATLALASVNQIAPEIYHERLNMLQSERDSLETALSRSCAEFRDELASRRFKVSDVAMALPEGGVLWEFIRYHPYNFNKIGSDEERTGPPRYLAFTLDSKGNITLTDLGDAAEIDSLVGKVRELIYDSRKVVNTPIVVGLERKLAELTGKLYEMIFAPLEGSLGEDRGILVSPDGQLNLIPFEIFPLPDGRYAIEKYRISYLSSGRDLLKFRDRGEPQNKAIVMADPDFDLSGVALVEKRAKVLDDTEEILLSQATTRSVSDCLNKQFAPLPYSRRETKSITKTLRRQGHIETDSYYGGEALEEVLKSMKQAPRILHLATHGYFCEDMEGSGNRILENPLLRSGLVFSGANRLTDERKGEAIDSEDGILTAFEVSSLTLLGTELVTLSACETGIGEVRNGEGVYGLRRAFQHAGAESIVMSLWKVPDKATYELMVDFYKNWFGGLSKREALRQSALKIMGDLRDKYGAAHPLLWGGFVLAGNPN